jgi:hypothetical protein
MRRRDPRAEETSAVTPATLAEARQMRRRLLDQLIEADRVEKDLPMLAPLIRELRIAILTVLLEFESPRSKRRLRRPSRQPDAPTLAVVKD